MATKKAKTGKRARGGKPAKTGAHAKGGKSAKTSAKTKPGKAALPSKRRASKTAVATAGAVTVRMFCQGLGDCFLITIPQAGARVYSILVDCGVALGTPGAEGLMKTVIEEIVALTGGSPTKKGTVDLLVVTHQHWDHVSGFLQAPAALKGLTFKHLWMAWTESETDPLAKQLRGEFAKAKAAIDGAIRKAAKLGASDPRNDARRAALDGLMTFFGPPLGAAAADKEAKGTLADAMTAARKLVGDAKSAVECLAPGDTPRLPGAASGLAKSIQAFVLGPPHDRAKLVRINPRESRREAYEKHKGDAPGVAGNEQQKAPAKEQRKEQALGLGINAGWNASILRADGDGAAVLDPEFEAAQPFDAHRGRSLKAAQEDAADSFFRDHYFDDALLNKPRRIDGDWLWSGAQRLALQLDSYTNNTSLVIAFELPKSKEVLLFVGDAQIGNWLSWHDQTYTTTDKRELTAKQLLERTVLYKVGHHGSHNATLREQGFELMTHPDMVAMLPVEADAVKRLGYGQMPLKSLVEALHKQTSGRILRVDKDWPGGKPPGTWTRPGAKAKLSGRTISVGKTGAETQRPLYMEVVIPDR